MKKFNRNNPMIQAFINTMDLVFADDDTDTHVTLKCKSCKAENKLIKAAIPEYGNPKIIQYKCGCGQIMDLNNILPPTQQFDYE